MKTIQLREYESLSGKIPDSQVNEAYKTFVLNEHKDKNDNERTLLRYTERGVVVQNYVGIMPIDNTIIEIYPKIPLHSQTAGIDDTERNLFYKMLRCWHQSKLTELPPANINKLKNFQLWDVFIAMFLHHTSELIRRGIVSRYQTHEDNLPYLKGRLLFPQQAVINSANKARFYVQYDDYTPNHAANRLVCRALHTLRSTQAANEQRRRQLLSHFDDVAPSVNIAKDWQQHSLDRGMRHYTEVMQWVRLLLYKYGLATYQGDTNAASLLFPMERVFENFVAKQFRLYAKDCTVHTQQPRQYMVRGKDENADDINMFQMQPDIMLEKNNKKYIVDTKWKEIKNNPADKYNISQSDMYQLYSYGRLYQCEHVALIYPANEFLSIEHSSGKPVKNYIKLPINQQNDKSAMIIFCLPFNIDKPEESVRNIINTLSAHS